MDFRLDEEQLALRDAAAAICGQHFDLAAVASREGAPAADAAWRALADLGLFGLLAADEPGGAVEAAIVVEQLGAHVASGPTRWSTIAALLPDANGARITGIEGAPADSQAVLAHATESDTVLVLHDDRVECRPTDALGAAVERVPFDPLTPIAVYAELPRGEWIGGPDDARRLRLAGTVLTAAELVGTAQGALDTASAYALERHQFGVPIGSFQAVKHLLADMYVRVELARSATYAAAAILDDARAGDPATAASTAKLLAGEAGIGNGTAAVQVLGGMGFTWEMLPHYFLKRAWFLEAAFGTSAAHALALGDALAADARSTEPTWT
jgi:alkylation response protein AidB-like acyl-CoA dehydrogenase